MPTPADKAFDKWAEQNMTRQEREKFDHPIYADESIQGVSPVTTYDDDDDD